MTQETESIDAQSISNDKMKLANDFKLAAENCCIVKEKYKHLKYSSKSCLCRLEKVEQVEKVLNDEITNLQKTRLKEW